MQVDILADLLQGGNYWVAAMPIGFNMLNDGSVLFSVYHVNNALKSYEVECRDKSL